MIVIRMGDINVSEVETGIVIEATREELRQLGNLLYREVRLVEAESDETPVELGVAPVVE